MIPSKYIPFAPALVITGIFAASAQAQTYTFEERNGSLLVNGSNNGFIEGLPFRTQMTADVGVFIIDSNLTFTSDDRLNFIGGMPLRLEVNGALVVPNGVIVSADAAASTPGSGGGAGGSGSGTGGAAGRGGSPGSVLLGFFNAEREGTPAKVGPHFRGWRTGSSRISWRRWG